MSKPVLEDVLIFSGRRNRKSYFLYGLLVCVLLAAIWGVALALAANDRWTGIIIALVVSLPVVFSSWTVGAQRCRDFGWTGWAMLITVIPYVGWIFAFAILFIPGNQGSNRYGPDPIAQPAP
jgi:uncharacterized membrane protein YhaH (DUF805 family)